LETKAEKKRKNGFTAIPDRIIFPHQFRIFIKRSEMREGLKKKVFPHPLFGMVKYPAFGLR